MSGEAVDWTALSSGEVVKQWAELSPEEKRAAVAAASEAELEVLRAELNVVEIDRLEREARQPTSPSSTATDGRLTAVSSFVRAVCRRYVGPRDRPDDLVRNLYVLVALGTIPAYGLAYELVAVEARLLDYSGGVVVSGAVFYLLTTLVSVRRPPTASASLVDCLNRVAEVVFLVALVAGLLLIIALWLTA